MEVWDFLRNNNFTKKEKLVVVGGGVIQDAAAFVGATYKRGILWHFFPTTLLAMCDSCIGAKSSINYKGAKNQLGLFSAPSKVIICEDFIKTLSPSDLSNGLGETLKLFLIGGERFLQLYKVTVSAGKVKEFGDYQKLILGALAIKKSVIEVDEFDLAYRKSLNFGHTFGHAVESLSDYQIPHGQAVAIGMLVANELSTNRGILAKEVNTEVKGMIFDLLSEKTRKVMETISMAEVGDLLLKDKKTLGKKLNFVILTEIGKTELLELPLSNELLQECSEIIHKNF
jgi:3-dehydroquinate synthase